MRFDPDEWGNVAEWVAAVGSAGALLIALTILRSERQDRRQEAERSKQAQARLITLRVVKADVRGETRFDDATGNVSAVPPWSAHADVRLDNNSQQPIRVTEWRVLIRGLLAREMPSPVAVRPGDSIQLEGWLRNIEPGDADVLSEALIVDINGRRWLVNNSGQIVSAP